MTIDEKLRLCVARDTGDGINTSICGSHALRFGNDFLDEVISDLIRSISIHDAGLDTMQPAARFALAVMASQYRYRTGRIITDNP
jgi:hypothetical protein